MNNAAKIAGALEVANKVMRGSWPEKRIRVAWVHKLSQVCPPLL